MLLLLMLLLLKIQSCLQLVHRLVSPKNMLLKSDSVPTAVCLEAYWAGAVLAVLPRSHSGKPTALRDCNYMDFSTLVILGLFECLGM